MSDNERPDNVEPKAEDANAPINIKVGVSIASSCRVQRVLL